MHLSQNALQILETRYLQKNAEGEVIETPEQLFARVAKYIAKAELSFGNNVDQKKWEEKFYEIMSSLKFLPNSPTLMNAGSGSGQLSACFVLPINDSIEGIFSTLKNAALIHQSGGGTGFNFSSIRPAGDFISPNAGRASGPISFMKVFDSATENIKQGGRRRGANMGILNVDHPDIEEFVRAKNMDGVLDNFNISIGIYDSFMQAVLKNEDWELLHPTSGKCMKKINAGYLWEILLKNAWMSGDPGLIFLDTINRHNPTPFLGTINCTNPCGEVPLLPHEACNLGSIDVSKFVDSEKMTINWKELEEVVKTATRFLDNVIEMNDYILPEIKSVVTGNRKIGLGIMGWADLLIKMEIPYAAEEAITLAGRLMEFIHSKSLNATEDLAKERGVFANWSKSIYAPDIRLRNATRISIAPTGTISILANTSSSIEPLYALAITRKNVLDNKIIKEVNEHVLDYLKKKNLYTEQLAKQIMQLGSVSDTDLPPEIKRMLLTAQEIEPIWHLRHQEIFQKYTDNAVSKTINIPSNTKPCDIGQIYMEAWRKQLKGITIYREGSKLHQVLYQGIESENQTCEVCRN